MGRSKPRHSPCHLRLMTLLLVMAVVVRALIPAGFMPNADHNGQGPALTMCVVGLSAPTVIYLDLGLPASDSHSDHPVLDCALGGALSLQSLQANTPTLALMVLFISALLVWTASPPIRRSRLVGAFLGARGPPNPS